MTLGPYSFPVPHAFYKSKFLEDITVLHYNNHDDIIHACVLKACVFIKVNVLAPSSRYSLPALCMYPDLLSCICVFLVTAMHV